MAAANTPQKKEVTPEINLPDQVSDAIKNAASLLGVAATELWGIFVRQFVVRGLNEAFTALVLIVATVYLHNHFAMWSLLLLIPALILCYGAINYLGNPKYYAIEDIIKQVKKFQEPTKKSEVKRPTPSHSSVYY